jgi:ketosteroid isomerase-like protein
MSQEYVEVVQSWFTRLNRGDRDFSRDELHPDFQVVSRLQDEPFEGREGLQRWMQEVDEQFREWELVADEWRDVGDQVVVLGRLRMRGKGSGVEVEQPHGWLVEFKGGKAFRFRHFARPQEALEAAGLRE